MRVLMLSKACIVGIYQRKLEYIAQQGIELLTLVPPSWLDERGEQTLERVYTRGYRLQATPIALNGNFHLHFYPHLADWMTQFQPDIVHIDEEPYNLATWQAFLFARRLKARALFFSWQNIARKYPPPFSWGEKWILDNVDYALMGTDSAGDVWRKKGYRGLMSTVPQFGTDTELFHPTKPPASRPLTLGYIGRLVEEKGVHLLLEAASKLAGEWRVRIVGGGPLRDELALFSHELGIAERVDWVGQVPSTQMPAQYHEMDVLVLPSLTRPNWKEQFGRVLVEAMASGIPVIGSDSGAIPGVVGNAGLIVPENNIPELTTALEKMQNADLRELFGVQGRKRVLKQFTHEQIAQETVRVYNRIMTMKPVKR